MAAFQLLKRYHTHNLGYIVNANFSLSLMSVSEEEISRKFLEPLLDIPFDRIMVLDTCVDAHIYKWRV